MLKRCIAWVLCVVLTVSCFAAMPMDALAATQSPYTYTIENGGATITDCDFNVSGALSIPATLGGYSVKAIGDGAFRNCNKLTSVTIPTSVTSIGDQAFYLCTQLTSVPITSAVTHIGDQAFGSCMNLKSIQVSSGNSYYSNDSYGALYNKEKTTLIYVPAKVSSSYGIPSTVTQIAAYAFFGNSTCTAVDIPGSVKTVGDYAFSMSAVQLVSVPSSVTDLGNFTFSGCAGLQTVSIARGLTRLGEGVFSSCAALTSITIPSSVTIIGPSAFSWCSSLQQVSLSSNLQTIGDHAFNSCESISSITLPSSLQRIDAGAFFMCADLINVTIPENVSHIGDRAFGSCYYLQRIYVNSANKYFSSDSNGFLCNKDKTTLLQATGNVGSVYTVASTVQTIGPYAFCDNNNLQYLTIPGNVKRIENSAFMDCVNMRRVSIESGLTYLGDNAFSGNYYMQQAYIPGTVEKIGDGAFCECESLSTLSIGNGVKEIGDLAFSYCYSLESVQIPDSVTIIGSSAFDNCYYMEELELGSGVVTIKDHAFYACEYLTSLTFPESLETIGDHAFEYCVDLRTIDVGSRLKSIGYGAFLDAGIRYVNYAGTRNDWEQIEIAEGNTVLDTAYFTFAQAPSSGENCGPYLTWKYENSVLTISGTGNMYDYTAGNTPWGNFASSIREVVIGDGVGIIGEYAFFGCTNLQTVTISKTVYEINPYAFYGASNLRTVYYQGSEAEADRVVVYMGNSPLLNATWIYNETVVSITRQPTSVTVAEGQMATVSFTAEGEGLTYQWYYKNAWESSFTKTTAFTGNTYSVEMNESRNGRRLYCVVTDKYGNTATTSVVEISMSAPANRVTITQQPVSVTVPNGQMAVVTFGVVGDGLTYQWYYKNAWESNFLLTTTFTGNTYSAQMNADRNGRQIYCVVTDRYGNCVRTNTVTIAMSGSTANAVRITKQPTSVTVANGQTATVSFTATGEGLTYKWYYKNKGDSAFAYTTSFSGNSYTVQMNDARNGRQLYCVVTDRYGNRAQTNTVSINMSASGVKITKQPTSVTVANGQTATVSFTATGEGLTYKWYYKNAWETKFTLTTTFTGNTYSAQMNSSRNGRQIYCVVTDKYGNSVKTNTVSINMRNEVSKVVIMKQPSSVSVPNGQQAVVSFVAEGDGLTYKWYYKNSWETKFTLTTTFTGNTYSAQMNSSRSGRQIYCVVTDQYGNSAKTNTVTISMR